MVGTADDAGAQKTRDAGSAPSHRTERGESSMTAEHDSSGRSAHRSDVSVSASSEFDSPGVVTEDWDDWQETPPPVVPLTREQAQQLFGPDVGRPSRVTPLRVVLAQIALTIVAACVAAVLSANATAAALSALIGGMICWIPGGAFAAYLRRRGRDSVGVWMLAEGVKLGLTIAMFIAVAVLYREVRWLPLLLTYVLALKTYWLALAWR
ncbi:ATP synthase subunit I [Robbsia sp. KACC 23696]|uniref:ATP synthase subunit I n=1 Tax=Robbsia sp. KACC 23696 TaxID=3149231 RepID=UPI00325AC316